MITPVIIPDFFRFIKRAIPPVTSPINRGINTTPISTPHIAVAPSPPLNFKKTDQQWPNTVTKPVINIIYNELVGLKEAVSIPAI